MAEIHRVLSPGGMLVITTPNVLVLRNVVSLLKNRKKIYYPYSSYGIYGRHNREWTLDELELLVKGCGYIIEGSFIVDTYPHRGYSLILKKIFPFLRDMLIVIGRAENGRQYYYPDNLYDSGLKQYSLKNPIPSRYRIPNQYMLLFGMLRVLIFLKTKRRKCASYSLRWMGCQLGWIYNNYAYR